MQSLKSNALEPTRLELSRLSGRQRIARLLPVYGLPILTVALILFFTLLLPDTFPTMLNMRSILGDKSVIALLSLAAMIPMMAGRIDLTVGYGIVLWHILAIALQTKFGVPWPVAVVDRAHAGLPARAHQRRAGRGGADQLLHRHAGHRHGALRHRPLVHGGQAGHRRPAERLSLDLHLPGPRHPDLRLLCAGDQRAVVDRGRVPADWALSLRHRRQSRAPPS